MKYWFCALSVVFLILFFFPLSNMADDPVEINVYIPPGERMAKAAAEFIASLNDEQRSSAVLEFDTQERKNWYFIPLYRQRKGLALEDMTSGQRKKAFALLQAALSQQGYNKAREIMALENVLKEIENNPRRNEELYYLTLFGQPSSDEIWGWRFEGHHLSFNFTCLPGQTGVTPTFMGSNPARVLVGEEKGTQVLRHEEELARAFVQSFSADQLTRAVISRDVPRDIISGNDRKVRPLKMEGIPYGDLRRDQQEAFRQLIGVYMGNMEESLAAKQWEQIRGAGMDSLHFSWIGGMEFRQAHYYRIHGPTILIEYDNVQNGANHIHTVWRDLTNDFGEDLLRKHYEESDHH